MTRAYSFVAPTDLSFQGRPKPKIHFTENGKKTLCGKGCCPPYAYGWNTKESYPTCKICRQLLLKHLGLKE